MNRKSRQKFDRNKAEELRKEGYCIKEIAEKLGCAEITCYVNLKKIKPLKYFKEISNLNIVYELYDSNDNCIYIGQSKSFHRRWIQHKNKSDFYKEISKIVCYVLESFPDMAFLEAQLIILKKPKYNTRIVDSSASRFTIEYIDRIEYNINGVKIN